MRVTLDQDAFIHTWATETRLDRHPYPVRVRETPITQDDAQRMRIELSARYPPAGDPDLTAALQLCARTDATTIVVTGETGGKPIRAFIAIVGDQLTSLYQYPSGTVLVEGRPATALSRMLIGMLGSAPAGREPLLTEYTDRVRDERTPTTGGPIAARMRQLLTAPADACGSLCVTATPENPLSPPARRRHWRINTHDGRYLCTTGTKTRIWPCDDTAFTEHITRLVTP